MLGGEKGEIERERDGGGVLRVADLKPPLKEVEVKKLKAGDLVSITGKIVTARDGAYERVVSGAGFPVDVRGGAVYHCGPLAIKERKRWKIISAGPTTSARLDPMEEEFIRRTGVRAIVGKGGVGAAVAEKMRKLGCIYLAFPGGAGVLAAERIEAVEGLFWEELGMAEAVWVLKVKEFGPLVVGVDFHGSSLYRF